MVPSLGGTQRIKDPHPQRNKGRGRHNSFDQGKIAKLKWGDKKLVPFEKEQEKGARDLDGSPAGWDKQIHKVLGE